MGFLNFFRLKRKQTLYSGGNGESIFTAVVINSSRNEIVIPAEYNYVISRHGEPGEGWTLECQELLELMGKDYDVLKIKLRNGELKSYYFNITQLLRAR